MAGLRSIILHTLIIASIAAAILWGNTLARQRKQFAGGEAALARGDFIAAVAGYESAIHMYTPWSPVVGSAAERLWSMGEASERKGETERALIAYRSLRSSFFAVRGLALPGREWIERCDGKIAKLVPKGRHDD